MENTKNNIGDWNTGTWNTGTWNTGSWNTADWNTGDWNTGDRNTGNWNTGDRNTGCWNTGTWNTGPRNTGSWNTGGRNTGSRNDGERNTGSWNTGSYHVGCFNTSVAEKAYYFNVLIDKVIWDAANKPAWIFRPSTTAWVSESDMTDQEKIDNPTFQTCGGYLRVNDMNAEWSKAFAGATQDEVQMVRDLPNFNADVFKEITGLDLNTSDGDCSGKVVVVDGVEYELKKVES